MEEATYDVPWELKLKNRAMCAFRDRPHSANDPQTSQCGLIKVSPSMAGQPPRFSPRTPERSPKTQNTSTSTSTPSPQEIQHQRVRSACFPTTNQNNFRNSNYPQVQIGHLQHSPHPPDPNSHSNGLITNSTNFQKQNRPIAIRQVPNSTTPCETPIAMRRNNRLHFDEIKMVHEKLDRVEAEKCLEPKQIGDYLLRRRADGNLAVSLRATETVMHIKLERRNNMWVLGEGPAFKSIGSVLRFYTKTELPIRGAEHVILREPLLT